MSSPEQSGLPRAPGTREETLARVVRCCQELDQHLTRVKDRLPHRNQAPFLSAQLDEELRRLNEVIVRLGAPTETPGRGRGGLARLLGMERKGGPLQPPPSRYEFQGCTRAVPVSEVIGFLSHCHKTGLLRVNTRHETFELEFCRGTLVHASSNASPPGWLLGELLVREELVEPAVVLSSLAAARSAGELLGSFLVRNGRLAVPDLRRVLTTQVQQIFNRMLADEGALFGFQVEVPQRNPAQELDLNVTRLLLENVQSQDEARTPSAPAIAALALEEPPPALPAPRGRTAMHAERASRS